MADESLWSEVTPALQAIGPVIPADLGRDDSIPDAARRILTAAPPRFAVVGFSMGGYVAREVVRQAPERVRALVLVATSARPDSALQQRRKAAAARMIADGPYDGLSRAAVVSSVHPDRARDEALIERVRQMSVRLGREVFIRQSLMHRDGDIDRLGEITCPTLVIAAAQDTLRGVDESREMVEGIPGADLVVLEGTGHMVPLEVPAVLAEMILTWMRGLPD